MGGKRSKSGEVPAEVTGRQMLQEKNAFELPGSESREIGDPDGIEYAAAASATDQRPSGIDKSLLTLSKPRRLRNRRIAETEAPQKTRQFTEESTALRAQSELPSSRIGPERLKGRAKDRGMPLGVMCTEILLQVARVARLFHTNDGTAFADVIVDSHREAWPLRGAHFRDWLRRQYYERTGDAPSPSAVSTTLNVLEAQAKFDGPNVACRCGSPSTMIASIST